jgi:hypothetical protein
LRLLALLLLTAAGSSLPLLLLFVLPEAEQLQRQRRTAELSRTLLELLRLRRLASRRLHLLLLLKALLWHTARLLREGALLQMLLHSA